MLKLSKIQKNIFLLGIFLLLISTFFLILENYGFLNISEYVFVPSLIIVSFLIILFTFVKIFNNQNENIQSNLVERINFIIVSVSLTVASASLVIWFNPDLYQSIKLPYHLSLILFLFFISFKAAIIPKLNIIKHSPVKVFYIWSLLLLITAAGFALRLYNLELLPPVTDEFYHLLAAKRYVAEGYFEYTRGIFVTYSVVFLSTLFGELSVYTARLAPVIVGTLTIPAVYFLWRRINPAVGLISALLFSLMPLAIGMSRYVREYSFWLLYLNVHFILLFYAVSVFKQKRKLSYLILTLQFLLPIVFYLFVENSNFVPQLLLYSLIAISLSVIYFYKDKLLFFLKEKKLLVFSIISLVIILISLIYSRVSWLFKIEIPSYFFKLPNLNYFDALFNPSFSPWGVQYFWFSGSQFPTFFIIGICFLGFIRFWRDSRYKIAIYIMLVTLIPFIYLTDRYYAIRYIYYLMPFYVLIIASGIYTFYLLSISFKSFKLKIFYNLSILLILVTCFSITPTISGLINESPGKTDPKKELHSYNYNELFIKLSELGFEDGDTIIASDGINNGIAFYLNNYEFISERDKYPLLRYPLVLNNNEVTSIQDIHTVFAYHYDVSQFYAYKCIDLVCGLDEKERISLIMKQYNKGWLIIDKDRNYNWNQAGFPLQDFLIGSSAVHYLDSTSGFRGIDIYTWSNF